MKKPNWWPTRDRLVTRVKLNETGRAFLEASIRADRSRRWRRRLLVTGVIVVLAAAAVIAGVGFFNANAARRQAQDSARQAIALHLVSDARDLLAQNRSGGDVQAFQELLAAHGLAKDIADGGLLDAIINRQTTDKIVDIDGAVDEVVFSPNDDRVATIAEWGTDSVWLWETGPDRIRGPLTPRTADGKGVLLSSIAFSPDGHRLATAGQAPSEPPGAPRNGIVQLWNVDTGQPLGPPLITIRGADVLSVGFSRDGRLAAASSDNTVRFWNPDDGAPLGTTRLTEGGTPETAVLSPDLHRVAIATRDGAVQLSDADKGNPIGPPLVARSGAPVGIPKLAFSIDGNHLAASDDQRAAANVKVWTLHDGQPADAPLTLPIEYASSLALSADGQRLAAGGYDKTVQVWDTGTGQRVVDPLIGHTELVGSVAFSSNGHQLASGSNDHTLRLWNPDAGQPLSGSANVSNVAFSPDGHRIAAATDTQVQLWNAETRMPAGDPFTVATGNVQSLGISSDGQRLIMAGEDHAWILNLVTGEITDNPLHGQNEQYDWSSVAISADGHRIATGGNVRPRTIPGDAPPALAVWNADTGQFIRSWPATSFSEFSGVSSVVFSPDGHLAAGDSQGMMRIWDAETEKPLSSPLKTSRSPCTSGCNNAMAFSSDGRRLAFGGDGRIALWDADTGNVRDLTGHQSWVDSVVFSPERDRLASGSGDKTLRFWNAKTGQPIGEAIPTGELSALAFSPDRDDDGKYLITGATDGVRIWPAVANPETLCKKITRNMSPQQWNQWVSPDPRIARYTKSCPDLPPD
jgi:WD40 repeat protein